MVDNRKDTIMAALEDLGGQATLTVESKLMEWLIKQADLLKLATMINMNDELTKWVKDGHELAQPFEFRRKYQANLKIYASSRKSHFHSSIMTARIIRCRSFGNRCYGIYL